MALAASTASSSVENVVIGRDRPKISSVSSSRVAGTPLSTVGS